MPDKKKEELNLEELQEGETTSPEELDDLLHKLFPDVKEGGEKLEGIEETEISVIEEICKHNKGLLIRTFESLVECNNSVDNLIAYLNNAIGSITSQITYSDQEISEFEVDSYINNIVEEINKILITKRYLTDEDLEIEERIRIQSKIEDLTAIEVEFELISFELDFFSKKIEVILSKELFAVVSKSYLDEEKELKRRRVRGIR